MTDSNPNSRQTSPNPPWLQAIMTKAGVDTSVRPKDLSNDEKINLYIEIDKKVDDLEQQAKILNNEQSSLDESVAEWFIQNEQERITRRGRTVYMATEFWPALVYEDLDTGTIRNKATEADAKSRAKERLVDLIKGSEDTSHLVGESFNWTSLRSFMLKDCERDEDGVPIIPPGLDVGMRCTERLRIRVTKS